MTSNPQEDTVIRNDMLRRMAERIAKKTDNGNTLSGSEYRVFQEGWRGELDSVKSVEWFIEIYKEATGTRSSPNIPLNGLRGYKAVRFHNIGEFGGI